ncbi:MAG: UbiA family prenyltransferase [candidate division Zixibacteria bacterium]|nr:UbiA family prenyltransferase [candidate division Zixibacteria bacterium]
MKVVDFFFAARPLLHLPIWSIYLCSLHYHLRISGGLFEWSDAGMMACLSLMVSGAYFLNQIHDFEGDCINRKLGFLQRGFISKRQMQIAYVAVSLPALALSRLFSPFALVTFAQFFLLGFLYSAAPFRLKDRPIWGMLVNAYSFGWLVTFMAMPEMNVHNAGMLGWDNPFYFFFAVAAVHILTTIPDRKGDLAARKMTVAVWLAPVTARLLALVLMLVSAFVAWRSGHALLITSSLLSVLPLLAAAVRPSEKADLLAAKAPILLLTLLAAYFFWGYLLFVVALVILSRIYFAKRFRLVYPKLA